MDSITLRNLLPLVFRGMENTETIRTSRIWEVPSFTISRGCRMCVQAESGSGKSSLLSFIYGNRSDYSGTILFDGTDIRTLGATAWSRIRTRSIALLPQEMRLFPRLTAMENICLKNDLTGYKTKAEIEALLDRLGISDKKDVPVERLSVGQQQRVAIVRTVCQPFDFIFLDEPVSHLDSRNNLIAARIVEEEASRLGAGIVSTSVGNNLLLDNPEFVAL